MRSAAYSPDGSRIVTASEDKTARVWDAASGKESLALRGHEDRVWSVAYSPDGSRIVTASWDKTARVWDAASGQEIVALRGACGCCVFSSVQPRRHAHCHRIGDKTARLWDATSGKEVAALRGHDGSGGARRRTAPTARASSPRQRTRRRGYGTRRAARRSSPSRGHEGPVSSAAYSPDGSRIVTASEDKTARVWDAASGPGDRRPARA